LLIVYKIDFASLTGVIDKGLGHINNFYVIYHIWN